MTKISWQALRLHQQKLPAILQEAKDRKLVLLIGDTDAGKSTTINILMDVKMVRKKGGGFTPDPTFPAEKVYCRMGENTKTSCTIFPQVVSMPNNQLSYLDVPGFLHVPTDKEEVAAVSTTVPVILQSLDIQGIFVVYDYNLVSTRKGQDFKEFMARLAVLLPLKQLRNKLFFVFTKVTGDKDDINEKIQQYTENEFIHLSVDVNAFTLSESLSHLDTTLLQKAINELLPLEPLSRETFAKILPPERTVSSCFYDLAIRLEETIKKYNKANDVLPALAHVVLVQDIYQALLATIKGFHRIQGCEVHVPNMDDLCGNQIKLAFAAFLGYYKKYVCFNGLFPQEAFENVIAYLTELRDLFEQAFKEADDQLAFFAVLIKALADFSEQRKESVPGELAGLPDAYVTSHDSALVRLRHLQTDIFTRSTYDEGQVPSDDILAEVDRSPQTFDRLSAAMIAMVHHYDSMATPINPVLFMQFFCAMIALEESADLLDKSYVDPHDVVLDHVSTLLKNNQLVLERLSEDSHFFQGLVDRYYECLRVVLDAQNAYIAAYQQAIVGPLEKAYSSGNNDKISGKLDLLQNPQIFINRFIGLTINRLSGGLHSGVIENRYIANHTSADLRLTLNVSALFEYLKSNIPEILLAAEYLQLLSFGAAKQTNEVYHPVITYTRSGDPARAVIAYMHQGGATHVGNTYSGWCGQLLFDASKDWTLKMSLSATIGTVSGDIFTFTFTGSYDNNTVAVYASVWLQDQSDGPKYKLSDPGGEGGYHCQLRRRLAPFVTQQWNDRKPTFSKSNQLMQNPDVTAWFLGHRTVIGNALVGTQTDMDSARQILLNTYRTALKQLNLAVSTLKLYSLLISKNPNRDILEKLVNSSVIANQIDAYKIEVTFHDLTPALSTALAGVRITGLNIIELPAAPFLVHPRQIMVTAANLIVAQRAWRVMRRPLPSIKVVTPAQEVAVKEHVDSLPVTTTEVRIKHRQMKLFHIMAAVSKVRELKSLTVLSLKNIGLNTEQMLLLLTSLLDSAMNLKKLNISQNNCADDDEHSTELREAMVTLIHSQQKLQSFSLAKTKLSTQALRAMAVVLAKNPALTSINFVDNPMCVNEAALDVLASLYVNTRIARFSINASSVHVLIADAIAFILAHKRDHAAEIPVAIPDRIEYFDKELAIFLESRAAILPQVDARKDVFKLFSMKSRVEALLEMARSCPQP